MHQRVTRRRKITECDTELKQLPATLYTLKPLTFLPDNFTAASTAAAARIKNRVSFSSQIITHNRDALYAKYKYKIELTTDCGTHARDHMRYTI